MKGLIHGFTMVIDGVDYGAETETVSLPDLQQLFETYRGGAMAMGVDVGMHAFEPMEATVKMSGHSEAIRRVVNLSPSRKQNFQFRKAVYDEILGVTVPHIVLITGNAVMGSTDEMEAGSKSGLEFMVKTITYFRYEVNSSVTDEFQAYPPRWIKNGVRQDADVSRALGY